MFVRAAEANDFGRKVVFGQYDSTHVAERAILLEQGFEATNPLPGIECGITRDPRWRFDQLAQRDRSFGGEPRLELDVPLIVRAEIVFGHRDREAPPMRVASG